MFPRRGRWERASSPCSITLLGEGARAALWQELAARAPRLKFAYISADFKDHPVAKRIQDVFGMHDRDHVEVCARTHLRVPAPVCV